MLCRPRTSRERERVSANFPKGLNHETHENQEHSTKMKAQILFDPDLLPYKVEGSRVIQDFGHIKQADAATFKPLNHHFSIDASHVFSGWEVLPGVSPESFRVLNELYASDGKKIYYNYGPIPAADCQSFKVLDAGYWRSDYCVIFEGYARDQGGIWFYSRTIGKPRILKTADADSFERLPYAYARDSKRVFSGGLVVTKADPASFALITQRYARDRSRIFYGNTALEGVDYASFEIVNAQDNQAKDKYHLYERHLRVDAYTALE